MTANVWDKNVPVELSSYLQDDKVSYFGLDTKFSAPQNAMIDLFCGAGGFSVGCAMAGFLPVLGIDHFKPAMDTWVLNHPKAIGVLGDIKNISPAEIKELLASHGINDIALLTGGVPCQGFTIANRKHNDFDERNFLFLEYMKFVKEFMPKCIVLENVSGMRSTAGGHFEKEIIKHMESLGYITTVKMINAADFGIPQIRQRLVFVGLRKDICSVPFRYPKETFTPTTYRTVNDAFSDLPQLAPSESASTYASAPQNEYQSILRGKSLAFPITPPTALFNHAAPNHPQSTVDLIGNTAQGKPMYPTFKQRIRLSLNAPSPTQLAGGIRPSFQFGHPTEPRGLTTRERARIQSFPDSYQFSGGIVQERVQTGNAVPPLMIYEVAKLIAEIIL